ncbi:lactonase family protein [Prevotella fusca]
MKVKSSLLGMALAILPVFGFAGNNIKMVVGTYTDAGSQGLYSFSFDQSTGEVSALSSLSVDNPSYFTFSKNGRFIYAVSEQNSSKAVLNCIGFDPVTGSFSFMNSQLTHGADPCYVDTDGRIALTANYSSGTISVFPILKNGTLDKSQLQISSRKGGPNRSRQGIPHAHCAVFAPDGNIFATDFSGDRLLSFYYNKDEQKLEDHGIAAHVKAGSGPRHLVFSPNGKYAYLMNELSGKVIVYKYTEGKLKEIQSVLADNAQAKGGADIHVSPDGMFVYASTRLKGDGITIFRTDYNGKLTRVGMQPTGRHPRNFAITPNGKFLLVACRDDNKIQVFSRDKNTGMLQNTNQDISLSRPACVKFYRIK